MLEIVERHINFSRNIFKGVIKIVKRKNKFLNKIFVEQLYLFGALSFPMVAIVSFFLGVVLTFQLVPELRRFGSESVTGGLIMIAAAREVAPVLVSIMIAGRMGSSMAAELGSMKITDQIDALKLMGANPIRYLVSPRVLSGAIMMPFLTAISIFMIAFASYILAVEVYGIAWGTFLTRISAIMGPKDVIGGVFKSIFFGIGITYVSCYLGITLKGRSTEVGKATTSSVAISIILVIFLDMILSYIIFKK